MITIKIPKGESVKLEFENYNDMAKFITDAIISDATVYSKSMGGKEEK